MRRGGGRPSGTDGSDYSYRMTVDDKYKRAARARMHLRKYVAIQAAFVLFKALWATLVSLNGEPAKVTTVAASIFGGVAVFVGTLGLKRTASPHLLKLFMLLTAASLSLSLLPLLTEDFFSQWVEAKSGTSNYKLIAFSLESLQEVAGILVQLLSVSTALTLSKSMAL